MDLKRTQHIHTLGLAFLSLTVQFLSGGLQPGLDPPVPKSIWKCVEAFLVFTMIPGYYWHLGSEVRSAQRVSHTAKTCLTSSANNTLIEKHHDHKFSELGLYFVLYSAPSM